MNIVLYLGKGYVANENDADLLINKIFVQKVRALRLDLKEKSNIDMPLIRILDSDKISENEMSLEFDGIQKWKKAFSSENFEYITDEIIKNIRRVVLDEYQ